MRNISISSHFLQNLSFIVMNVLSTYTLSRFVKTSLWFRRLFLTASMLLITSILLGRSWSLPDAIQFAQENNPDAKLALQRIQLADAQLMQARAAYQPMVSVTARYSATNTPMHAFGAILNQEAFNFGLDFNHPGMVDNLNLSAMINYNLFDGGSKIAGREAAEAGLNAAQWDKSTADIFIGFMLTKALLNEEMAREVVKSSEAAVAAFEENLKVALLKFEAGSFLKTEVLNLDVQLAQSQENLVKARHAENLAERAFFNILGLKERELVLDDSRPSGQWIVAPKSLDYSNRGELLAAHSRIEAAESMLRQAKSGHAPRVDAFAGINYDRGWETGGAGDSWMAGVRVQWNIFDGHLTKSRIQQAEALLAQVLEMKNRIDLSIDLEVENASLFHQQTVERLAVTEKMVEQALESAELSRSRFESGVILSSDLIDIETRLTDVQVRRSIARVQERLALAELRRALGLSQI